MSPVKQIWKRRVVLIVMLSVAVFSATAAARMTYRRFQLKGELTQVEQEIAGLKGERDELNRSLDAFGELATIEQAAREVLNLQREGESVVILLPSGEELASEQNEVETKTNEPKESGNLVKWWAHFFAQ